LTTKGTSNHPRRFPDPFSTIH